MPRHPEHLLAFDYTGPHRYSLTFCTESRRAAFTEAPVVQLVLKHFLQQADQQGFAMLAYCFMPDHVHLLVYSDKEMKEVLRLLNGVAARRVIQYLKENSFETSLLKLRGEVRERNHRHSVWQHHSDSLEIVGEETFRQKVEYIHQNPVRAGLVESSLDYQFSSCRQWSGESVTDEALLVDRDIDWR